MNPFGRSACCSLVLLAAGALAAGGDEVGVQGVSPGEAERAVEATSACPSFSWSAIEGASAYRLALFEIRADGAVEPVFTQRIEGAALSWTPPRERCLLPGRDYAWVVRAERGSAEATGAWSRPLRFRVPGVPTADEVRAALELLGRWQAAAGQAGGAGNSDAGAAGVGGSRQGAAPQAEASTATGVAAIRGEIADVSGEASGVFGISHSPQGAGVVARNESAGADLILDGEAQNTADTLLTESGIDRPSAAAQTFEIRNSGAGSMTLSVEGTAVSLAGHPHAGEAITSGTVAEARIDSTLARDSEVMGIVLANDGPGSGLDADTLDGVQGASLQRRVSGVCPEGQAIRSVHPDGSVVCYEVPLPPRVTTVYAPIGRDVGRWVSVAIGTDGFPVMSYFENSGALGVAKCNDVACAGGDDSIATLEYLGGFGWTSIAIGNDGNPVISYFDGANHALKVAKCNDSACAGADETITTVDDSTESVGNYSSIAIGTDGFPVISYYDETDHALRVAKCNDQKCSGKDETISTVDDPANNVGSYTSLAIGTDGFPVISYADLSAGDLKVAKCNDAACAGGNETITTVDASASAVGAYSSIAIGIDGNPVISYMDAWSTALKVARCKNASCSGGDVTITTVEDPFMSVGSNTSIAIGADGFPVISHHDSTFDTVRVVKCNDVGCVGGDEAISVIDDPVDGVGFYVSMAIGTDGSPVIAYQSLESHTLKVAKCRNSSCSH